MCRIASLFVLQRLKGSMSGDARDFNINIYLYMFSGDKIKKNELGGLCRLYK